MGPSLSENIFLYGSEPENIYLAIYQGRPNGMPAWGAVLPDAIIWDLVTCIGKLSNEPNRQWGRTFPSHCYRGCGAASVPASHDDGPVVRHQESAPIRSLKRRAGHTTDQTNADSTRQREPTLLCGYECRADCRNAGAIRMDAQHGRYVRSRLLASSCPGVMQKSDKSPVNVSGDPKRGID